MYNVAICDDCKEYREALIAYLREVNGNIDEFLIYQYDTGEKLIEDIEIKFDLLFLDMQLPGIDGNEVAREVRSNNSDVILVFCSGILLPSPENFVVQPFRYIVKQQSEEVILEEINVILNQVKRSSTIPYLGLTSDGAYVKVPVNEILYVSIIKRGSEVHLKKSIAGIGKKIKTNKNIVVIEQELIKKNFVLIHKSYLVNMEYIAKILKEYLVLEDGTELQISRSKRQNMENAFSDFLLLKY